MGAGDVRSDQPFGGKVDQFGGQTFFFFFGSFRGRFLLSEAQTTQKEELSCDAYERSRIQRHSSQASTLGGIAATTFRLLKGLCARPIRTLTRTHLQSELGLFPGSARVVS